VGRGVQGGVGIFDQQPSSRLRAVSQLAEKSAHPQVSFYMMRAIEFRLVDVSFLYLL
jgi:hypothetical protein